MVWYVVQVEIGEKLKQLRLQNELTQEDLGSRCDLSKGFISQVERGLTSPSIATLVDILECLGSNLNEFFQDPINVKTVYRQEDIYSAQDDELGYKINWIVPNAQKHTMEPITVRLRSKGRTEEHKPYPGEVFGYVTAGTVILHVGKQHWRVKKGDCFYFVASEVYYLENTATQDAVVLWVTSPPNF